MANELEEYWLEIAIDSSFEEQIWRPNQYQMCTDDSHTNTNMIWQKWCDGSSNALPIKQWRA